MAVTDVHVRALIDVGLILFPIDAPERISLIRDVVKPDYDFKACEAVIRLHATRNKFIDFPALTAEMAEANGSRSNQVGIVTSQAIEEMRRRRQKAEREKAEADASLARVDGIIAAADPTDIEAATKRVLERLPHLKAFVRRNLNESPTLKSGVAAELEAMQAA